LILLAIILDFTRHYSLRGLEQVALAWARAARVSTGEMQLAAWRDAVDAEFMHSKPSEILTDSSCCVSISCCNIRQVVAPIKSVGNDWREGFQSSLSKVTATWKNLDSELNP